MLVNNLNNFKLKILCNKKNKFEKYKNKKKIKC